MNHRIACFTIDFGVNSEQQRTQGLWIPRTLDSFLVSERREMTRLSLRASIGVSWRHLGAEVSPWGQ